MNFCHFRSFLRVITIFASKNTNRYENVETFISDFDPMRLKMSEPVTYYETCVHALTPDYAYLSVK